MPNIYHTSAAEFFSILLSAMRNDTEDLMRMYRIFNRVLNEAVNQKTEFDRLRLPGLFAKINHLVRTNSIDEDLSLRINHTRVRLHAIFNEGGFEEKKLKRLYSHDFKAVTEFVAAIFALPVPNELAELFPVIAEKTRKPKIAKDCVRVIVKEWDADCLYVVADSDDSQLHKVCYSAQNPYLKGADHFYLPNLLQEGTQLNLVRLREKEGMWLPELIILEPDILIDVSSVAACMEHYGDSPYTYLLNRIRPSEQTEAIIMGNFAGMLLDNALQSADRRKSYRECAVEFFRRNALQLATCRLSGDFHTEGQRQYDNIEKLLREWQDSGVGFSPDTAMVEPTFFCEMLGLQGRMDFLQLDYSVLMEQKSGKGAFPPNPDADVPNAQEKHYAQMILYMAILHYNFKQKNSNAYLLYSKYRKGLLGLGPAPELLYRAIRLRNQLAWLEKACGETDLVARIFSTLRPEHLNINGVGGTLWERYTYPQIAGLLAPIHAASELERTYFYRMLRFVFAEHLLGKVGDSVRPGSGFASKWHESIEEKVAAGSILFSEELSCKREQMMGTCSHSLPSVADKARSELGVRSEELLSIRTDSSLSFNFRKGDIVVLYAYKEGEVPDLRRTMVFRCSIADIREGEVLLRMRSPQSNEAVFRMQRGDTWCIEHDYFDSSSTSLLRGLYSFLLAPTDRRALILSQREPRIDTSKTLQGDYGDAFNPLQLRIRQAQDLFLIVGPPGTGKTSFGMLNTLKEVLTDSSSSVLLLSYTNRAVDEICSKLIAEGIDFLRIGGSLTCSEECQPYLLDAKCSSATKSASLRSLLSGTRVYAATTTSMNAHSELFKLKHFDLAIVDEASQILEPHIIGLLSAQSEGRSAIDKFVLIGDHKQLPAVVQQEAEQSVVTDAPLLDIDLTDCRHSFFERMYRRYKNDPAVCFTLTSHGRMHEDIALFPNSEFYQNRLQVVPLPHQIAESKDKRVVFIDSANIKQNHSSLLNDKVNPVEAEIIAELVVKIYNMYKESFDVNETIGVIVPYRNQITTVRNCIDRYGIPELHDISIDTVERFQGSQRKVIIYGFTISRRYQLNFLCSNTFEEDGSIIDRKLNVAMTRAMDYLYLVGNAPLLSENLTFRHLIEFTKRNNAFF